MRMDWIYQLRCWLKKQKMAKWYLQKKEYEKPFASEGRLTEIKIVNISYY